MTIQRPEPPRDIGLPSLKDLGYNVLHDSGDAGKSGLLPWFEKMHSQPQCTRGFAVGQDSGLLKEDAAVTEEIPAEGYANVDRLIENAEKREKKDGSSSNSVFGNSHKMGGIIFSKGKPIIPYSPATLNAFGNSPGSYLATVISFSAHQLHPGYMYINFDVCTGPKSN